MQAWYDARFERDMGLSASEFARCMPGAFEPAALHWTSPHDLVVSLTSGKAHVRFEPLPERAVALIRLQRVRVWFDFGHVDAQERQRVMKRFDLVMLRGGG